MLLITHLSINDLHFLLKVLITTVSVLLTLVFVVITEQNYGEYVDKKQSPFCRVL